MSVQHTDVAAYSLGLLDQKDREEFEAHLAGCESCSAELAEFSSMADLFLGVGPVSDPADEPGEAVIIDLVARQAVARRRRSRQRGWLAAAASVVVLAGGVAAGAGLASRQTPPDKVVTAASAGIKGTVELTSKTWGTQVVLKLSGVPITAECQLVAVPKTGKSRVVMGWQVLRAGLGTPGHPPLLLHGSTSVSMKDLSEMQVQIVSSGGILLTIPIST